MKKLFALLTVLAASAVQAQEGLNTLNDEAQSASVKIRAVPLGSGTPSIGALNAGSYTNARSLGNGLYQVPGYMPGYPTAATIFPRVVQVRCGADGCEGYTITPAIGRGEYVFVQPITSN
jgi:hypothetical protein